MHHSQSSTRAGSKGISAVKYLLILIFVVSKSGFALAQGQLANGTISSSGTGPYFYSLTFSDDAAATQPVGSVWYSWVPGAFYLPGPPSNATVPAGWSANISGHSIQFVASSASHDILPGQSLSGFGYEATFSPSQLAATRNSGLSVAYSGGLLSDAGFTFTVQAVQAVPEPSVFAMLISAAFALKGLRSRISFFSSARSH